jgi:transcription antitermination factor NusG
MPLLRKESEIHPEELFTLSLETHPWWVAHVRSRREKALVRQLERHDVAFYLPQIEQRIRRDGRTFVSYLPLFPGYVFFRGPRSVHDVVWRSEAAASLVEVPDQGALDRELGQIRALQKSGATLRPFVDVAPGDPVRITAGAFKGYTGVLLEERGGERLIVSVSLLKKAVAVEFPRDVVAPVPGSRPRR